MSHARSLRLDLRVPVRAARHQPVHPDFEFAALHARPQKFHDEAQPADLARAGCSGGSGSSSVRVADEDERLGRIGRHVLGAPACQRDLPDGFRPSSAPRRPGIDDRDRHPREVAFIARHQREPLDDRVAAIRASISGCGSGTWSAAQRSQTARSTSRMRPRNSRRSRPSFHARNIEACFLSWRSSL